MRWVIYFADLYGPLQKTPRFQARGVHSLDYFRIDDIKGLDKDKKFCAYANLVPST